MQKIVGSLLGMGALLLIITPFPSRELVPTRGAVLVPAAAWRGVDVYNNGRDPWYAGDDSGYGYEWQCVELVQRFYRQIIWSGYDAHWPDVSEAYQMFDDPDLDLQALADGSAHRPVWGDVLVFAQSPDWPSGHAAVVTRVAGGRVEFVQQNVGPYAADSLPIDGANHVGAQSARGVQYPPLRGWLHSPRNGGMAGGNPGGYAVSARSGAGVGGMH